MPRIVKWIATALAAAAAAIAGLVIWHEYVEAPWTRDGRIRVQVANVAPQVSGQITELHVVDNQRVEAGDLLYVIDRFDFQTTLSAAASTLQMRAADLLSKRQQAERRAALGLDSTSVEEKQVYASTAAQAEAMFRNARSQMEQAQINLHRTHVRSPVNGTVTNMQMRLGDYARSGTTNLAVVDADSFWIDGYFEETKMRYVCVGDRASARLMGYPFPIEGVVESITRGISVSDAAGSTQGLPAVNPVYTWVRLAQRVPVRIRITGVPAGIPLVAGMTATISLDSRLFRRDGLGIQSGLARLVGGRHDETAVCSLATPVQPGLVSRLPGPPVIDSMSPRQLDPGLAGGMTDQPGQGAIRPPPVGRTPR